MKKIFLLIMMVAISISLVATFSMTGCKTTEKSVAEEEVIPEETVAVETEETEKISENKVTIRYAHAWATDNLYSDMLQEWAKQYPNLTLVEEVVVGDEMKNKITTDASADNLPDIFNLNGMGATRDLVEAGLLLDINEYLNVSKSIKREDIPETGWSVFSNEGIPYGIPMEKFVSFMCYNKAIFDEFNLAPPKTYEEMVEVAKVLNANGIIPLNMGSKGGNPAHFWYSEILNRLPGGAAEIQGLSESWNFNTENQLNTAKTILQQKEDGIYPKDTVASGDWNPSIALYNEGKTGMCYSISFSDMVSALKPEIIENSVLMDIPQMPGSVIDPSTITLNGGNYGVYINAQSWEDSEKQPYLLLLADWINSDETLVQLLLGGMNTPIKKGVVETIDTSSLTPYVKFLFEILKFSETHEEVVSGIHTAFPTVDPWRYFLGELDVLFSGGDTAEQFIQKIQKSLDDAKAVQ